MNKEQIKKILKPLIKECIKEVIFEDGTLSTVISEVVKGLGKSLTESHSASSLPSKKMIVESDEAANKRRQKLRKAIGTNAYNGVNIFEGTTAGTDPKGNSYGALRDTKPQDSGVDISSLMENSQAWKRLSGK